MAAIWNGAVCELTDLSQIFSIVLSKHRETRTIKETVKRKKKKKKLKLVHVR